MTLLKAGCAEGLLGMSWAVAVRLTHLSHPVSVAHSPDGNVFPSLREDVPLSSVWLGNPCLSPAPSGICQVSGCASHRRPGCLASKPSLCVSLCVMHCGLGMSGFDALAVIFENHWPLLHGQLEDPVSNILWRIP